jgi:hypothetical protein
MYLQPLLAKTHKPKHFVLPEYFFFQGIKMEQYEQNTRFIYWSPVRFLIILLHC